MVEILFAALLGVVSLGSIVLILAPFRRRLEAPDRPDENRIELLAERDASLRAILELEFDYRVGKLAEEDYRELSEQQKLRALALLRTTSGLGADPMTLGAETVALGAETVAKDDPLDAEIERRVREERERRSRDQVRSPDQSTLGAAARKPNSARVRPTKVGGNGRRNGNRP